MTAHFDDLHRLLIDGAWVETPERLGVENKYSGAEIAQVCVATPELIAEAVATARAALEKGVPAPHERAAILYRAARLLEDQRERFIALMVAEAGFTRVDAATEVMRAGLTLELSAEVAKSLTGHTVPFGAHPGSGQRIGFTVRDPIGVVVAITPFNSPLNTVLHKIGPALPPGTRLSSSPPPSRRSPRRCWGRCWWRRACRRAICTSSRGRGGWPSIC